MLRNLVTIFLLGFALAALPGCGTLFSPAGTIPVDQALSPQAQQAQTAINEANVVITAVAQTVIDDITNGVMTGSEAQPYQAALHKARDAVKVAEALFAKGDLSGAQAQAELIRTTIVALQRQLAARAKTGG